MLNIQIIGGLTYKQEAINITLLESDKPPQNKENDVSSYIESLLEEINELKARNKKLESQNVTLKQLMIDSQSKYDEMKQPQRRFTGSYIIPIEHKPYGYLLVDETQESVRIYQNNLPKHCPFPQKNDRFEFGMLH